MTSLTVVKIEYDPRVTNSVLDLTSIINDILPKAQEYNEDLVIDVLHKIESPNADPHIILTSQDLDLTKIKTKIKVVLKPSSSSRKLVESNHSIIRNNMDPKIELMISGYRFKIIVSDGDALCLLTNRADTISDVEIIIDSESAISIQQKPSSDLDALVLNATAYDLVLKGRNNQIRALEYLLDSFTSENIIHTTHENTVLLNHASLIAGKVGSILNSKFRVDTDILIDTSLFGGILVSTASVISSTELIVNGNVTFEKAKVSGIMAGLIQNLSNSSIKIRGSVLISTGKNNKNSNVIGLMAGSIIDVFGEIRIDIRERVLVGATDEFRQIGIIAGMIKRSDNDTFGVYSTMPKMIYDLTFLENTFKKKIIEGPHLIKDIGIFTNADIDRAVNSMIDFSSGLPFKRKPVKTETKSKSIDNSNVKNVKNRSKSKTNQDDSNMDLEIHKNSHDNKNSRDKLGGIFKAETHVDTNPHISSEIENNVSVDIEKDENDADIMMEIINTTRQAIISKRKTDNHKSINIKNDSNKNNSNKNNSNKNNSKEQRRLQVTFEDDLHSKTGLYDRRSDARILIKNPSTSKSIEQNEEAIFAVLAEKVNIEDRRLSKDRNAIETRLGRLKKNIHIIGGH